ASSNARRTSRNPWLIPASLRRILSGNGSSLTVFRPGATVGTAFDLWPSLARRPAMADDVIISADSHMNEPPDLWLTRMDRGFRDRAPRIVHEHQGKPGYWFICEGLEPRSVGGTFAAGKTAEELKAAQKSGYEAARPGGWDPVERLKDQAIDGVA